jgi:hypothetical protein
VLRRKIVLRIRAKPESPQRKKPMGCRELKSEPVSYFNDHAVPRLITADLQAETDGEPASRNAQKKDYRLMNCKRNNKYEVKAKK